MEKIRVTVENFFAADNLVVFTPFDRGIPFSVNDAARKKSVTTGLDSSLIKC